MKVFESTYNKIDGKSVAALGNFDGLHIGHVEIIRTAVEKAHERGAFALCYTFSNHPRNMISGSGTIGDPEVKSICSEEEKLEILDRMGVDLVYNIPFNLSVMTTPPETFIRETLAATFAAVGVSCGFNYRFGSKASGDVELLKSACDKLGIETYIHDPVEIDGRIVSSTLIRDLIEKGEMETCERFLGRSYSLSGQVMTGNKIGHTLGFPTANFLADESMQLPPNGVYFSQTLIEGISYDSVTNIGVKPTVGDYAKTVETNIEGFDGDLYGKNIRVMLLKWSRPEIKFGSFDELKDRISKDKEDALRYHAERARNDKLDK